jgi:hypothetical protein
MPTFADMVSETERRLAWAKAEATVARDDSKAKPADPRLRVAAQVKSDDVARAGREHALWVFEEQVEREYWRIAEGDSQPDPVLIALAPTVRGETDWIWPAAANLQQRGIKPPAGWRSSTSGEALNNVITSDQG